VEREKVKECYVTRVEIDICADGEHKGNCELRVLGGMNPQSRLEKEIALNILRINKATLETIRGESKK
jgi:hypothetical protein